MRLGLRKMTLLDYPGLVACTVFTGKCNFRCPFCHNASLVVGEADDLEFDQSEVLAFLRTRVNILDGVCITGGEPLLHTETLNLLAEIKALGFKVKLDTNGSFPKALKTALNEGLVDTVAMDIKNSPSKYALTSGSERALDLVAESVEFLLESKFDYEFRTTVTGNLHQVSDFTDIGGWLFGAERYFLQKFVNSGDVLDFDSTMQISDEQLQLCLAEVQKFIPQAAIRGA